MTSTTSTDAAPRDLLIVGSGIAGLSAAVAAADSGASVIVVERATLEESGGNTRWTESYFRMKSESEVSDDFEQRLVANAGYNLDPHIVRAMGGDYASWPPYVKAHGMPDPELVSTLASHAGATVKWLTGFGVRFAALPTYFMTAAAPRLMPIGGGLALIEALRARAITLGVEFAYSTTAIALRRDDGQGWLELTVAQPSGETALQRARSVLLACGGFQGNPEMLTQYLGQPARYVRPVARGGYYNKGEGIRMALACGAAPAGDFSSYHAEPLDPRSEVAEALVMNFPYGILVNTAGQRFIDEAPGPIDIHYDPISRAIGEQPDGIAYVIFDAKIEDVPNWRKSIRSDKPPFTASSLEELAVHCSLSPTALAATVAAYNAACTSGNFIALAPDGLATRGLPVVKSNWARPVDTKPFYAYPIIPGICFTYGGFKTNAHAQIVDNDGRAIPGLYGAGEAAGLYYQVYTGATSVLRGAVFGKIAGQHAADRARTMRSA